MSAPASPSSPFSEDLSGRSLDEFRLLRLLGRGAMADVYLAEQADLNRQVAVKVLRRELAQDETYVKRFQREAQAAAALSHANIVQIYKVGRAEGIYYIAQEYVQGLNLRQWLNRHGAADLRLGIGVLRQVAAALAKAAEYGIVHRDIKPENIILTRSGEAKVADFGLARIPPRFGEGVDLTQAGITLGTPLYMSPEQVEGKPLDHRSDLYSLGITCYHLLAGAPPFSGETALSVAVQHLKKQADPLENLRPDLPPALCRIVHRLMAKEPERRYPTARDLLREVHQVQVENLGSSWPDEVPLWESGSGEVAVATRNEATQRLDSLMKTAASIGPARTRWLPWLGAAVVALLAGGTAAYFATAESPLLPQNAPRLVEKQENVFRQWIYASQLGTEEAWQAVIEHFPDRPYFAYRAKQQLARLYLNQHRLDQAMAIFTEFAALEETESELRAYGLAGQCVVLTMQQRYHDSAQVLDELLPISSQLRDPFMHQLLNLALRTNRNKLAGNAIYQKWQEWIEKHPDGG